MSLNSRNFAELSESDLNELISTGVPEGFMIEYKRPCYGSGDADVKEFLKDVSSFANAAGGHLILGMAETGGVASEITPINVGDADKELQRMESMARDGIEPRIVGIQMKHVPLRAGGSAFILRIPKSWNPPHRVSARGTNRFYARTSAGAYEVSVEELRVLFARGADARDRLRAFRAERLARIAAGDALVPLLARNDRIVIHVLPLFAFGPGEPIDLDKAHAQAEFLRPIGSGSINPRLNFDGLINVYGADENFGYTQLFRNGCIEAVEVGCIMERDNRFLIPSLDVEQKIVRIVPTYARALNQLGVSPPIIVMITLQGVRGAFLGVDNRQFLFGNPVAINRDTLELPEVMSERWGERTDYEMAIRPALDVLWNAAGYRRSKYFADSGEWIGEQRTR
jgi:hypothetical protein